MATIKKIILLALAALMVVGCTYESNAEIEEQKRLNGFNIKVVDSCEYLYKKYQKNMRGMVLWLTKATVISVKSADKRN